MQPMIDALAGKHMHEIPARQARAVIAEDEPLLADALRTDLATLWPELEIVASVRDGRAALEAICAHQPDIAFLDIRMPLMDGLEVAHVLAEEWPEPPGAWGGEQAAMQSAAAASSLQNGPPLLVFVTAYDAHAIEAFELAAVDYLLKPVERRRLQLTLERLRQRLDQRHTASDALGQLIRNVAPLLAHAATRDRSQEANRLRHITAGVGNQVRVVSLHEVVYLQSTDKYVAVATPTGELLLRSSLSALEPRLPETFLRIHRSCIVNMDYVSHVARDEFGRVRAHLRDRPESLPVSRLYVHHFRAM